MELERERDIKINLNSYCDSSSNSLDKENLVPLLNGVCDVVTVNTYKAVIMTSLPPFSPTSSPRPLSLVKAFKENC